MKTRRLINAGKQFLHSDTAITIGAYTLLLIFSAGANIINARIFGVNGRGEISAIQTWIMLFAAFGYLGIPDAIVYYVAREQYRASRFVTFGLKVGIVSALLVILLLYFLLPFLLSGQSTEVIRLSRIFLAYIPLWMLVALLWSTHQGLQHTWTWNAIRISPNATLFFAALFVWLVYGYQAKVSDFIFTLLIFFGFASLIALSISIPLIRKRVADSQIPRRNVVRYGMESVMATGPRLLNLRLDQGLMAIFLTASSLGIYAVAASWAYMGFAPIIAVGAAAIAPLAAVEQDKRKQLIVRTMSLTILLTFCIAVIIWLLTPFGIVLLFGNQFTPAISVAQLLIIGAAISTLNGVWGDILRGLGVPRRVLWAEVVGLVVTITSLFFLIPRFGIIGAAWASVGAYATVQLILLIGFRIELTQTNTVFPDTIQTHDQIEVNS